LFFRVVASEGQQEEERYERWNFFRHIVVN
jgi:hypothetical protein